MKINDTIREILIDLTAEKRYNACMAEELASLVRDRMGEEPIEDEVFDAAFYRTVEDMINQKELGRSGRGNIVCGAQMGYVTGTFRANAK